jgi:hypothetical protein
MVDAWIAIDGSSVTAGDPLLTLAPSAEMVWEALRALYFVGQPEDLPLAERFIRGNPDMPDSVRQQAALTARAIRQRQGI